MKSLAMHLCDAINEWIEEYHEITIGELEVAFQEVMDAVCESAVSHDRDKSFGENVIPFVQ